MGSSGQLAIDLTGCGSSLVMLIVVWLLIIVASRSFDWLAVVFRIFGCWIVLCRRAFRCRHPWLSMFVAVLRLLRAQQLLISVGCVGSQCVDTPRLWISPACLSFLVFRFHIVRVSNLVFVHRVLDLLVVLHCPHNPCLPPCITRFICSLMFGEYINVRDSLYTQVIDSIEAIINRFDNRTFLLTPNICTLPQVNMIVHIRHGQLAL